MNTNTAPINEYNQEEDNLKPITKETPEDLQRGISFFGSKNSVPRMNKNLVLGVIVGLGIIIFLGVFFSLSPKKNKSEEDESKYTNVKAPDFGNKVLTTTKFSDPTYSENGFNHTDESQLQDIPKVAAENPFSKEYVPPSQTKKISPQNNYNSKIDRTDPMIKRLLAEEEAARRSSMMGSVSGAFIRDNNQSNAKNNYDSGQNNLYNPQTQMNSYSGNQFTSPTISDQQEQKNPYKEQNMQDSKMSFYSENTSSQEVIWSKGPNAPLGNLINTGTIIPGILLTAINSDNPGQILGMVSENIYSFNGENLLIPQGSKIIADYNSSVSWNQKRLQIRWSRLILPNGQYINLGNMPGTDSKGASGYQGNIDNHLFEIGQGLGFLAAFSLLNAEMEFQASSINSPGLAKITNATEGEIKEIGSKFVDRALDIQPTITIPQGQKINIFVNTDLALLPYKL